MLSGQRHREILARIESRGQVRVMEMADLLGVTDETIRRDLKQLDAAGKLRRTHGGAVAVEPEKLELPFDIRRTACLPQKRAMALRAIELIEPGDVIAMDPSTTICEMARLLPDMPVTVVTNSIVVAMLLADRKQVRVISTGGVLEPTSLAFVSALAEPMLDRLHIAKLFLSCRGLDLTRGPSEANELHAAMKQRMMQAADQSYLLADHSKLGTCSLVLFAAFTQFAALITDAHAPAPQRQQLDDLPIPVHVAV